MSSSNRIEDDEEILYVIGVRRPRLPPGQLISTNNVIPIPGTEQRLIRTNDGTLVLAIWKSSRSVSAAIAPRATTIDNIIDRVAQITTVTALILVNPFKRLARVELLQAIRETKKVVLTKRIGKITVRGATEVERVRKLGTKRLKVTAKIAKKADKITKLRTKIKRSVKVVVTRRLLFGSFATVAAIGVVTATAIDIVVIAERAFQGGERAGVEGFFAGVIAGIFDAATLGLLPTVATSIEAKAESLLVRAGIPGTTDAVIFNPANVPSLDIRRLLP